MLSREQIADQDALALSDSEDELEGETAGGEISTESEDVTKGHQGLQSHGPNLISPGVLSYDSSSSEEYEDDYELDEDEGEEEDLTTEASQAVLALPGLPEEIVLNEVDIDLPTHIVETKSTAITDKTDSTPRPGPALRDSVRILMRPSLHIDVPLLGQAMPAGASDPVTTATRPGLSRSISMPTTSATSMDGSQTGDESMSSRQRQAVLCPV